LTAPMLKLFLLNRQTEQMQNQDKLKE